MSYVLSEVNCIFWKKCRGKRPDALYKRIVSDLYMTVWKKIIWGGECWLTCPSDMVFCGIYISVFFSLPELELTQADDIHVVLCCVIWQIDAKLLSALGQVSCDFVSRNGKSWRGTRMEIHQPLRYTWVECMCTHVAARSSRDQITLNSRAEIS